MYNVNVIGTCSLCGGRVTIPAIWMSIVPPVQQCETCGAVRRAHGPAIDMEPSRTTTSDRLTTWPPFTVTSTSG